MKSGGPWNLRGLRPEAREAARTAARRSGMSVGEWLNNVIELEDEDDAIALFADDDRENDEVEYERPRRSQHRHRERRLVRADRQVQQQIEFERRVAKADRRHAEREDAFDREVVRTRSEIGAVSDRLERLSQQMERMASRAESAARRRPAAPPPPPRQRPPFNGDQNHDARLTGAPASPHRTAGERLAALRQPAPAADHDSLSIDDAVAEITARQRVLDGHAAPEPAVQPPPKPVAAPAPVEAAPAPAPMIQAATPAPAPMPVAEPEPSFHHVPEPPVIDIGGLEQQLRQITARIEGLKPSSDLENTIAAIRADLIEIAHLITEALPRRAVESLEIEVKALGQRIEHTRECGVDTAAISGLERGLSEVREALHGLTPAENLVGFEEAVKTLSQKVDIILAKDDPAALQQLETAIGALRGIVSHVASNETLTKVAEDIRALSATVDRFANSAASGQQISALENRIEALATALTASSEAGHAVPRELDKLPSGLIEKLEWVQLTHTDHAALAHLEDRIATLVQRFDASEAKFNHLEAVERGLADLLVHLDQIRGVAGAGAPLGATQGSASVDAIERDIAEIKQSELRTQDSLEAVQGAVEQVVDRLAMIESGIREQAQPAPPAVPPPQPVAAVGAPPAPAAPAAAPAPAPVEHALQRAATARKAIDPSLPPDHPLEPGSTSGRSRSAPSAADRIAASEAAVSAAKPPVIADPGKSNFIAAARRAAQAAAATAPAAAVVEKGATASAAKPRRVRPLILAGAAALIVLGCLQFASRMFVSGGAPAPQPAVQEPETTVAPPASALPQSEPPAAAAQPEPVPTPAPAPALIPAPMSTTPPNAAPMPDPAPPVNNPKIGNVTPAKPVQRSAVSLPEALAAAAAANGDVTGSLPRAGAPAPPGDKLPAAIGDPALRAAALSGNPAAAYEIAMRFAEGRGVTRSNEEAALWLERAAKSGLVPAQFRIGGFYEKGIGVKKNLVTAREFYLAAAAKGNGKAMHNLAVLYAEGVDGTPDYPNAAHWFREAANHGVTDSQYNLGILYARGTGVAQNYAESYKWFMLVAMAGDQDAAKKAEEVASRLDRQSLAAAQLAVKTFTAIPQLDDAVNVKTPAGGWDTTASAAPAAKPKTQTPGVKAAAPTSKAN